MNETNWHSCCHVFCPAWYSLSLLLLSCSKIYVNKVTLLSQLFLGWVHPSPDGERNQEEVQDDTSLSWKSMKWCFSLSSSSDCTCVSYCDTKRVGERPAVEERERERETDWGDLSDFSHWFLSLTVILFYFSYSISFLLSLNTESVSKFKKRFTFVFFRWKERTRRATEKPFSCLWQD